MTTGRKPKPTALKVIAGNPGKRALNASEPRFPSGGSPAPDWLGDEAAAAWNRLAPALESNGMLTVADADALAVYCDLVGRYVEARRAGDDVPMAVVGQMRQLASEFGFTPAARSRVAAPKPADDGPQGKARFFG